VSGKTPDDHWERLKLTSRKEERDNRGKPCGEAFGNRQTFFGLQFYFFQLEFSFLLVSKYRNLEVFASFLLDGFRSFSFVLLDRLGYGRHFKLFWDMGKPCGEAIYIYIGPLPAIVGSNTY